MMAVTVLAVDFAVHDLLGKGSFNLGVAAVHQGNLDEIMATIVAAVIVVVTEKQGGSANNVDSILGGIYLHIIS